MLFWGAEQKTTARVGEGGGAAGGLGTSPCSRDRGLLPCFWKESVRITDGSRDS